MHNPIPKTITRDQYVAAIRAFWAVLDVDPGYLYHPVILGEDSIVAPAVPATEQNSQGRPEGIHAAHVHPQGDEFGEYACMVNIKVVEQESGRPLYGHSVNYTALADAIAEQAERLSGLDGVGR